MNPVSITTRKRPTEAYMFEALFEHGMGTIYISRFKGSGLVESGVFLVDMYCLGVKDAFFSLNPLAAYDQEFSRRMRENQVTRQVAPAYARKLIEGSVRYAQQFGFAPDAGYKKACKVFGGIDIRDCAEVFTYGFEGKPHYMTGPNDSPERAQMILSQLERACGPEQYHFTVVSDVPPGS